MSDSNSSSDGIERRVSKQPEVGDEVSECSMDSEQLDSDEENCKLLNNEGRDLNFECQ